MTSEQSHRANILGTRYVFNLSVKRQLSILTNSDKKGPTYTIVTQKLQNPPNYNKVEVTNDCLIKWLIIPKANEVQLYDHMMTQLPLAG